MRSAGKNPSIEGCPAPAGLRGGVSGRYGDSPGVFNVRGTLIAIFLVAVGIGNRIEIRE
jgi:hypothetical protein